MRRTLVIILLIAVLFPWAQTHAKELLSGNELVQLMREYYDATWFFYADTKKINARRIAAVVAKFLNQHPEKWNRSAWDLVMEALQETFPRGK
jgi:hypothetical protein